MIPWNALKSAEAIAVRDSTVQFSIVAILAILLHI